jgi:hypothetical protein
MNSKTGNNHIVATIKEKIKMKNLITIAFIATFGMMFMTSCGHNVGMVGIGTGFRAGGGEYGINYGEGLFGTFVTKDGIKFKAELDSTTGFSYDPSTNSYKGIRSVEYSLPPQITGYAVDFAKENPEVAKAYYEALVKYYDVKKDDVSSNAPLVSDEKSESSSSNIADILKKAIDKAKSIVSNKEADEGEGAVFQCNGNCEYDDLTGNPGIEYQLSIAMKLLSYNGYDSKFESTGEYYTNALENFITQLVTYESKGHKNTPLRVKYVTVKDKVIDKLMFIYIRKDGSTFDVDCPNCIIMDDEDAD